MNDREALIAEARALLLEGASDMRDPQLELTGGMKISRAGELLVAEGGLKLAREVHATLGQYQRTVELQWFGLTDGEGVWLP